MTAAIAMTLDDNRPMTGNDKSVIFASSLGTVFEWYDFYLYGWTATQIGRAFFSAFDTNTQFIFALLTFSVGFLVRPLGALLFGRLGDLVGRKHTFLVTIAIMGLSTFFVGLVPDYRAIGWAAPTILIGLRLFQGLALGGEYGGAAVYVAEHAPQNRRGFYTSWIQTTATIGLFLSLIVVLVVRNSVSPQTFSDPSLAGGWRIPYLLSIVMLGISIWIRLRLGESPIFLKMKDSGRGSKAPLLEAFGNWTNGRIALIALGLTAGEAVIWYGGQFYARIFLVSTLRVAANTADLALIVALIIATAGFPLFGWLSDRTGRKPIILAGCLLAAATYHHAFGLLTHAANPALEAALANAPVTVAADPSDCNLLFDPVGGRVFRNSCDVARQALIASSVNFRVENAPRGSIAKVRVGDKEISSIDGDALDAKAFKEQVDGVQKGGHRSGRGSGLSHRRRRSGGDRHAAHDSGPRLPRDSGHDGLWPNRRGARRIVSDPHPLFRRVAALSRRQRLVRRPAAADRGRIGRCDRRPLCRSLVSGYHRRDGLRRRADLPAGNQGPRHPRHQGLMSRRRARLTGDSSPKKSARFLAGSAFAEQTFRPDPPGVSWRALHSLSPLLHS